MFESWSRQEKAVLAWQAEFFCLILTAIYSFIALHDIYFEQPILTSPAWFSQGFCVWSLGKTSGTGLTIDSHLLCFIGDFILGGPIMIENMNRIRKNWGTKKMPMLWMTFFGCLFSLLHGLAHFSINQEAPALQKIPMEFSAAWIGQLVQTFFFMGLTPYIGYFFGCPGWICVVVHAVLSFLTVVAPQQFGFGMIQLMFNLWICAPRLWFIGTNSESDVAKRVDHGWFISSLGTCALMPIVFAEMLACEGFYQVAFGHFLYDTATVVGNNLFVRAMWDDMDKKDSKDEKVA